MFLLTTAAVAFAQSAVVLEEGPTLLQPCLDIPACTGALSPTLSETLSEVGYALHNESVGTTALGGRGIGAVAEIGLHSMPLGPRNVLQESFPSVPGIPRFSLGALYGAGTRKAPGPQLAAALHGLPRLSVAGVTTGAFGGTLSGAYPIERHLFVGAELGWTRATVSVPLIDSVSDLRDIDAISEYIDRGRVLCEEPCVDRMVQNTVSARIGAAVEPVPAVLAYLRLGLISQSERLHIALDDSVWRLSPVVPEASFGAGVRADDTWQFTLGATTARRPAAASSTSRSMTRVVLTTALRLGPKRT